MCCAGLWRLWPGTSSPALFTPQTLLMLLPLPVMLSFPRLVLGSLLLRILPKAFRMPLSELLLSMSMGPLSMDRWRPTPVGLGRGCRWLPMKPHPTEGTQKPEGQDGYQDTLDHNPTMPSHA